jgi:hypothetical protein
MENLMVEVQEKNSNADHTICVSRDLCKGFGFCGALLIQKIHFCTTANPEHRNGHAWCCACCEAWAMQFEGMYGPEAIRKQLKILERMGVLVIGNFNRSKYTEWYRIDYTALCSVIGETLGGFWHVVSSPSDKSCVLNVALVPRSIEYIDPEVSDPLFCCLPLSAQSPVLFFPGLWFADTLQQRGLPAVQVYWRPPFKNFNLRLITSRTVVVWPVNGRGGISFAKKICAMLLRRNCRVQMVDPTTLGLKDGEYVVQWLKKRRHLTKKELLRELWQLANSASEIPSLS